MAEAICVEQTIEFPADLVWKDDIRQEIIARIDTFEPLAEGRYLAKIRFNTAIAGTELTQLMNVFFGNASMLAGVRLESFALPDEVLANYSGPNFGGPGLRRLFVAPDRPLLATALKPMGLSSEELAELAGKFALGGIDIIKDDHGLADQAFSPFATRVEASARAVADANRETGGLSRYFPNVTAPADQVIERARFARDAGAGGVLFAPGLAGFDTMRLLAAEIPELPIMAHPALLGAFVVSPDHGLAHAVLFGHLHRLAGADIVVFPNYGGRFSFRPEDCRSIARAATEPLGNLAPILPAPAGGMTVARVPEMVEFYGPDVILLIGGDLHRQSSDLVANCRGFLRVVGGG
ncbi:MAG: ribulose 1,5-bisphosphate carboxylase large subunit, partial [Alphaproteobacteria bacterium]|nr:ribulose 1,5-bisphosphate carboxylase large subunit [Alphaproteobacteria bacterium]